MTEQRTAVIVSADYAEREAAMRKDPIVQALALEMHLGGIKAADIAWPETDTVRHEWAMRINAEFHRRGGTGNGHIGAVPSTVARILRDVEAALQA